MKNRGLLVMVFLIAACLYANAATPLVAAPTNDAATSAIAIPHSSNWCSALAGYTTMDATADGVKPSEWGNGPNYNVWFKFQATSTSVSISLKTGGAEGTMRNPMVALHTDSFVELRSSTYNGEYVDTGLSYEGLTIGDWYYINVDNASGLYARGTFTLCVNTVTSHDYPAGAIELTNQSDWCSGEAAYTTMIGTPDGANPTNWWNGPNYNVWFKFQATSVGVSIGLKTGDAEGTLRYPRLSLHNNSLVEIQSTADNGTYTDIGLSYEGLTIGEWYYINADNAPGWYNRGSFTLCLSDVTSEDYPSGAIVIAHSSNWCSGDAAYTTVIGTPDGSKPSNWSNGPNNNVWFKFQATTDAVGITLKTGDNEGTLRYPRVALHDSGMAELRSNTDDGMFEDVGISYVGLTVGEWYFINVDNASGLYNRGTFTLCTNTVPSQDYPVGAIELTDVSNWCSNATSYSTIIGTPDGTKPSNWSSGPNNNIWFKFQATTTSIAAALKTGDSEGTLSYPRLALHDNSLVEMRSAGDNGQSQDMGFSYEGLTIGEWYFLNVDNAGGSWPRGTFTLCIDDQTTHDYPSEAIELTTLNDWCSDLGAYTTMIGSPDGARPSNWPTGPHNNVWFKFQANTDKIEVTMKTGGVEGTISYPRLALHTDSFTELMSAKTNGPQDDITISYEGLTVGDWYYLNADNSSQGYTRGSFSLCVDNLATIESPGSFQVNQSSSASTQLNWLNEYGESTDFEIERSTISGSGYTLLATVSNGGSYEDLSLSIGNTYYYRVRATNSLGTSEWSDEASVTMLASPPTSQGLVWDIVEFNALKDLFESTNGTNWTNKTNWPTAGNWPVSATASEMDSWHGIYVTNGDISSVVLSNNQLTGGVPASIGDLTSLTHLQLNTNQLTSMPVELGNLSNLQVLYLYTNQLTGSIPSELGNLMSLQQLWLSTNQLTGTIPPTLGNLSNLTSLYLSTNQLSGTIPSELGNLSNLQQLLLNNNLLTGGIPASIGSLTSLTNLQLQVNQLTSMPAELGNLSNLQVLYLYTNQLTGSIPSELGNLTSLQQLWLSTNQLTGTIPPTLGNLSNLTSLYLSTNQLSGTIPSELGNLSNLQQLLLNNNLLTGGIPASIGSLTSLTNLQLQVNQLTSMPAELGNLSNLQVLYLYTNQLTGSIPSELGNLTSLQQLWLSTNQLTGTIPPTLGNLSNLTSLYLSTNQLSGTIPSELGNLSNLQQLLLNNNSLIGEIPQNLSNLSNLTHLQLESNKLTALSDNLLDLTNLAVLQIYDNNFGFDELEKLFSQGPPAIQNFLYIPQKPISDIPSLLVPWTTNILLQPNAGQHSTVSWEKQQPNTTWLNINAQNEDATQNTFLLSNATDFALSGNYRWKMTNSIVPGLTLESEPILVTILDPSEGLVADQYEFNALKELYDSLGGASWYNKTNWPTPGNWPTSATAAQLDTWFGITVTNGDITSIALNGNNLNGKIPGSIETFIKLNWLSMASNSIHGSIPSTIGNLHDLQYLYLTGNALTGAIPSELGNLTNLLDVQLGHNSLSGAIPASMNQLNLLTKFYLNNNNLTGAIPDLSGLVNLTDLYFGINPFANGPLPEWLDDLPYLNFIDLGSTNRTGAIPAWIGNISQLDYLELGGNQLSGNIPSEIGNLSHVTVINLESNNLSGSIPSSMGNLSTLQFLSLDNNSLSGAIPSALGNLSALGSLYLSNNQLTGAIPTELGNLSGVAHMDLRNNQLSGSIPASFGNLANLYNIVLSDNQLTGSIPPELGTLPYLETILFQNNQLSGTIPASFGTATSHLRIVWLSNNNLSGELPSSLSDIPDLEFFRIESNQFTGEFPAMNNWTKLSIMDIGDNQFSGAFPASVENCIMMTWLNAPNNQFTSLPESLLNMHAFSSNFSGNELNTIPDFSLHPSKASLVLQLYSNRLDYTDLEPLVGTGIGFVQYSPQKEIIELDEMQVPERSALTLTPIGRGQYGVVSWEYQPEGGSTWTNINAQNEDFSQNTLVLSDFQTAQAGSYRYIMTNTLVTGITLTSEPIQVIVVDPENGILYKTDRLYNGNITAMRWKTEKAFAVDEEGYKGMYLYEYDDKYQLKEAQWAIPDYTLNTFAMGRNEYRVTNLNYDPNGNIQTLTRYNGNAMRVHDFNYTYAANTNKLQSVSGYTNAYTYNAIGQMIGEDKVEGDDQFVEYDVTGKVRVVYSDAGHTQPKVEFKYDDRGFRLAKINHESLKTTWYIRDASGNVISIYEQEGVPQEEIADTWNELYQVEVVNGVLALSNGFSSGSASIGGTFETGQNGSLTYQITDSQNGKDIGFRPATTTSPVFYFRFSSVGNTLEIRKSSTEVLKTLTYQVGDELKIIRNASIFSAYVNGLLQAESTFPPVIPLEVFAELSEVESTVSGLLVENFSTQQISPITQTEVPVYGSGKLGTYYPQESGTMAYELTDHLGNVRAILKKQVTEYVATMEDTGEADLTNPRVQEMAVFKNLFETEVHDARMNHTPPGQVAEPSMASYLYWVDGMSGMEAADKAIGPAINLKINPGDTVDLSVWAKFENKVSYGRGAPVGVLAAALGGTFAVTEGLETLPEALDAFTEGLPLITGSTASDPDTRPYAYLNYLIFDEQFAAVDGGAMRVPESAGFDPGFELLPHEQVAFQPIPITTTGFMYVWVSNESEATKVWFDDLTITHRQDIVAQATDYGPWGDVIREQRTNALAEYRYGYQGQFAEKDEETGWNHFELREFDPVIGRWMSIDPFGQYWSPYIGMGNNPANSMDPNGGINLPLDFLNDPVFQDRLSLGDFSSTFLDGVTVSPNLSATDRLLDAIWVYGQIYEPELYVNLQYKSMKENGRGRVVVPVGGGISLTKDGFDASKIDPTASYISYKVSDALEYRIMPAQGNNTPGEDASFRMLVLIHQRKSGNGSFKSQFDVNVDRNGNTRLGARVVGEYQIIRGKSSIEISGGYRQKYTGFPKLWTLLPGSRR